MGNQEQEGGWVVGTGMGQKDEGCWVAAGKMDEKQSARLLEWKVSRGNKVGLQGMDTILG